MSHAPLSPWHGCFPITDWNNTLHLIRNVFNHILLCKGYEISAKGHPSPHRICGHSKCELLVICLQVTAGLPLYALHFNEVFLGFWNLPGWRTDTSHNSLSFSVYETEIRIAKLDRNNLHSLLHSSWLEPELQCTLAVDFFSPEPIIFCFFITMTLLLGCGPFVLCFIALSQSSVICLTPEVSHSIFH